MSRLRLPLLLLSAALFAPAQDFKDLEKQVTDFTLANGLRFLVVERHDAPVIHFRTHVSAGSANDPAGASGLARMFERLAFKGTETIGTLDAAAEKKALDAVEEAYDHLEAERNKGRNAADGKLVSLKFELQKAITQAQGYSASGAFLRILEQNGVSGVTAGVSHDSSDFHCALPSNRAELWFSLESQRLLRPVFRDFYKEREAAIEDNRRRVERNPEERLLDALSAAAFAAHPYRNPAPGWPGDLAELRQADARQFFNRYYTPSNITIAIVGDVNPQEARRLADRYFGPLPARPVGPPPHTQEPPQTGPKNIALENALQPLLAVGFKRPDEFDRDDATLDVAQAILAGGHASWLQKELVETKRIAAGVYVQATYPGGRSPHLFTIMIAPAPGHSAEENEKALNAVLARLRNEPLDPATLARGKAQARANLVRRLNDNASIGLALVGYAADHGDWRKLFSAADALTKVTAEQVQLAALKYFIPSRRTTVVLLPPPPVSAGTGAAQ